MKELTELWRKDEEMHGQKLIYKLRLQDKERLSQKQYFLPKVVFSKVFNLDENNLYGFAVNKPLPIRYPFQIYRSEINKRYSG